MYQDTSAILKKLGDGMYTEKAKVSSKHQLNTWDACIDYFDYLQYLLGFIIYVCY